MVLKVRRTLESRTDEDSANRDFKILLFVLFNFAALRQCTVKRSIYSLRVAGIFSRPVSGISFELILQRAKEMKVALRSKLLTMLTVVSILVTISQISHNIVIM